MKTKKNETVNAFFDKKSKMIFVIACSLCVVFAFMLFNVKITEGGDDSEYIMGAWKLLKGESFPFWHGAFYSIFLSLFLWIFGMKLIIFKLLSFICIIFHLLFFYQTFKNRIPSQVLSLTIMLMAVNAYILVYASLTYSEALYFLLQIVCIFYIFKITDKLNQHVLPLKIWKEWLILGFFIFLIVLTRNIGLSMLLSIILFFGIYKNWYASFLTFISFLIYYVPFYFLQKTVWNLSKLGFAGQFGVIFSKNPYYPAAGKENLVGVINRFLENTNQYISKHLLIFLGLRPEDAVNPNIFITLIGIFILIVIFRIIVANKNKFLIFIALYVTIALCVTFISMHTVWSQGRLILVYLPFIIMLFLFGLYEMANKKINKLYKLLPVIIALVLVVLFLGDTTVKIKKNIPILARNIAGNKYYGFTPDWINYLKLSEWCANNLPKDAVIGCRKPTMSFIYGDCRNFEGIYQFPVVPVDSFINLAKNKPSILLVSLNEINNKLLPGQQIILKQNLWAILVLQNTKKLYGVFDIKPKQFGDINSILSLNKLPHTFNYDTIAMIATKKNCSIIYPDSLVKILRSHNMTYILDGSLVTGIDDEGKVTLINTIKKYILIIKEKYPLLFELVKFEGETNKAFLFKIHWENLN